MKIVKELYKLPFCTNHLQSARVRREEYVGEWLPEPRRLGPRLRLMLWCG